MSTSRQQYGALGSTVRWRIAWIVVLLLGAHVAPRVLAQAPQGFTAERAGPGGGGGGGHGEPPAGRMVKGSTPP